MAAEGGFNTLAEHGDAQAERGRDSSVGLNLSLELSHASSFENERYVQIGLREAIDFRDSEVRVATDAADEQPRAA